MRPVSLFIALVCCVAASAGAEQPPVVVAWTSLDIEAPEFVVVDELVSQHNARFDACRVWMSYREPDAPLLPETQTDIPPDLILAPLEWIMEPAHRELWADLTTATLEADAPTSSLYPLAQGCITVDGKTLALPVFMRMRDTLIEPLLMAEQPVPPPPGVTIWAFAVRRESRDTLPLLRGLMRATLSPAMIKLLWEEAGSLSPVEDRDALESILREIAKKEDTDG